MPIKDEGTDSRASWTAPQVRRLAASEAENGLGALPDGGLEQFS
jgi:hypothetical protein